MKIRFLRIVLGLILMAGSALYADKPPATAAGKDAGKLTIWTSNENVKKAIEASIGNFEKEMGAKVEVVVLNKELTSGFKIAAVSKKGPDILVWANDVVGELAESGLLEPINLSPQLRKAYLPVALQAFTYKKQVYGYPYDLETVALIYNKALVNPPPKSMEEVLASAKKLTDKKNKKYGFLYDINNFYFSFALFSANGGYVFKDNKGQLDTKDVGLANPGAIAGGDLILAMVTEDIVPRSTSYNIASLAMSKGELAMTINGPWLQADLVKNKIDYAVMPIPAFKGKKPQPFVGSHGFMIRRSSDNKDLAKIFIEEHLVSKQGIITMYEADPRGPCRYDAIEELTKKDPHLAQFMLSVESGYPMPNVPEMGAVWAAMNPALELITSGRSTPKQALENAVKQIKSGLEGQPK